MKTARRPENESRLAAVRDVRPSWIPKSVSIGWNGCRQREATSTGTWSGARRATPSSAAKRPSGGEKRKNDGGLLLSKRKQQSPRRHYVLQRRWRSRSRLLSYVRRGLSHDARRDRPGAPERHAEGKLQGRPVLSSRSPRCCINVIEGPGSLDQQKYSQCRTRRYFQDWITNFGFTNPED